MNQHQNLFFLLLFALIVGAPAVALGQSDVREAGNELRFRVIDRFPAQNARALEIPRVAEGSPFYAVIQEVEKENWSTAWRLISSEDRKELLATTPSKRFLAGVIAMRTNHFEEAFEFFESLDGELSVLDEYRWYYQAEVALQQGKAHEAALAAAQVSSESRLYPDALFLLARALVEAGEEDDRARAEEVLELYLNRYSGRNDGPRARLLLGDVQRSRDSIQAAAQTYLSLRDDHPLRQEARQAERHLEALKGQLPEGLQQQISVESQDRILNRYRGLYNQHSSDRVISELPAILEGWNRGSEGRCEATFMVAHSYTKLRRHGDGTPWYDRVLSECRGTSFEIRALYLGGRGRWNAGDRLGAMEIFERIWTEFPDHSFADDAMYFTGRILRSENRHEEARARLQEQVERYPDGDMAKDAHWLLVRRMFDEENYDDVVAYVDGLSETGEDDLYSRGRLHYFRARALEMNRKGSEAAEGYVKVIRTYPMTYYAFLALHRLARSQGAGEGSGVDICATAGPICEELLSGSRQGQAVQVPRALQRDRGFDRGVTLLSLGLTDLARAEFSALRSRHASAPEVLWALASLLDQAGAYPLSHDIARRHIPGWMESYPSEETRKRWEIAYPTPFKETVLEYARKRELNPALIFAIMREESGFNPRVESWANARGLLQLIEDTARRTAASDGLSPFSFEQLYDPSVNIRLGSAYMANLGSQAQGHPALIMAGYNAGFGVVSRWIEESGELPLDLFVEDIPFGQTRHYVKRVLMSYWIYSYLYGDDRVPPISFEL